MARSLTVKSISHQVEKLFGRQSEKYVMRLINDALLDISSKKQYYTKTAKRDLIGYDRWYSLLDEMIDIERVEVLDTNSRYVLVPKLSDSHKILRADTDESDDSLT